MCFARPDVRPGGPSLRGREHGTAGSVTYPERVVQELAAPVRRFLGRCVGDSPVADDLAQETLIRARVAADHFRNPVNRVQIVDVDESGKLPDEERAIDQRLVVDEMNTCVRPVIDTLPEDYRLALVLHDLEGLTAAQTAEVCGCSVPTAKIRIHRARLRLREALQTGCDFYRDGDDVLRCDRKT
jgi:RNA polymerase sigma-70 factor (ECF subfamily)